MSVFKMEQENEFRVLYFYLKTVEIFSASIRNLLKGRCKENFSTNFDPAD